MLTCTRADAVVQLNNDAKTDMPGTAEVGPGWRITVENGEQSHKQDVGCGAFVEQLRWVVLMQRD